MVRIFSPGTIGNVGPGFDVLGLAVDGIGDYFEIEESSTSSITITGRDADVIPTDPKENTVTLAAQALFSQFGINKEITVAIERHLPSSGGLGASASSSVAGALGAAHLIGKGDDLEAIVEAALVAESHVAGRHLDNIAPSVYGGLTLVQSTDPVRIYKVPSQLNLYALLVTPRIKIKTKDARAVLPDSLGQGQWVQQMANSSTLVLGFTSNNHEIIKHGLNDHYSEKFRSSLIPGFDDAKSLALQEGALGFSISGAGPTCFALFEDQSQAKRTAEKIQDVFDYGCSVHVGALSEQGARVL